MGDGVVGVEVGKEAGNWSGRVIGVGKSKETGGLAGVGGVGISWARGSIGTMSVASYNTKLPVFLDELDFYHPLSTCACYQCGEGSNKTAHHNEDRLMQFLMGLNDTYNPIRGQILLLKPVPDIREAYNMVTQDEKQREIGNDSLTENFSVAAAVRFPKGSNSNKSFGNPSSFPSNSNNEGLFCRYCKNDTHTIETCYKLHGFPPGHSHHDPNFKPKSNRPKHQNHQHGAQSNPSAAHAASADCSTQSPSGLSTEQYQ
ncbi:hypothetical protein Vadar_033437 [Vaccinium darrowii]|uniref:Uncharacterized protein n=1 Tax=Vaccinium darrowii TaxID=229202 RepID=A0ACB7YHZ8_9ERIC|nr:hypothetical protein Vadar_033437 [Vaccinium darrowii]